MTRLRRHGKGDPARVAAVVQRLAVLLAAGVPPRAAWEYLDEGDPTSAVASRVSAGGGIPESIAAELARVAASDRQAWLGLAAAWAIATDAGAPLASTLRVFAQTQRDLAQSERDVAVALASPVATARLVVALPLVGLLFGLALGIDTFTTLATTPIGWACLVAGALLLLGGWLWTRRLVRSARPRDRAPGLACDLTAIALAGGGSIEAARASVRAVAERFGLPLARDDRGIDRILRLSSRAGVPAAELLRSEADERRRSARSDAERRAQALSVRLMLPLGVCVLPAFMVLGVVPLLVTVIGQTSIG